MATTLFPDINVVTVTGWLALGVITLGLLGWAGLRWTTRHHPRATPTTRPVFTPTARDTWRMPPLALLEPVVWKAGTKLGMLALRAYLVAGAILLVIKAIQLTHH